MTFSTITFASLGSRQDMKAADIIPVITAFQEHKSLSQIICSSAADFPFKNIYSALPRFINAPLRRLGASRSLSERIFDYRAARALQKCDAVLVHSVHFPRVMRQAKRLGIPVVGMPTEAHPLLNKRLYEEECRILGIPAAEHYPWVDAIGKAAMLPDYLIVHSAFVRDSYIAEGFDANRIYIAALDIDRSRFVPALPPAKFTAVYMAHTQILKGLGYLLEAWESAALPDAELIVVGSLAELPGPVRSRYEQMAGMNRSIRLVGATATPEEYYAQASVFVFPSLTEGYGRAIEEALASGLPVITTVNAQGIVEDGKNGFTVPIRDAGSIAQKLRYLYNHPDEQTRMSTVARETIEQKKLFGEAVYDICQEIVKRASAS